MADETKPKEEETSASASEEETTQGEGEETAGETAKTKPEPDTIDYKTEFKKEKEKREGLESRIDKADRRIVKLKNKMDVAGVEEDEGGGLSREDAQEIANQAAEKAIKPFKDELDKTKGERDEALRTAVGKANVSPGGGEGGQKPPIVAKPPKLAPQDQGLIATYGLKWDANKMNPDTGEKGVYTDKKGVAYPISYQREGDRRIKKET